jgi:hypothetical protein
MYSTQFPSRGNLCDILFLRGSASPHSLLGLLLEISLQTEHPPEGAAENPAVPLAAGYRIAYETY